MYSLSKIFFEGTGFALPATVLKCADTCKDDYDEWIAVLGTRVVNLDATLSAATSSPTLADSSEHIELQMLPSNAESSSPSDRTTPEPIRVPPPYSLIQASAHVSSPLARPSPPETVIKLRDAWYHYLDSRVREWKIAGTTACIPDASDDPVTRSIAFFALCRALSGIVYGPIFPIYFRTLRARSAHFAMLWAQV
ncbi:hypothetical protein H0H93_011751 [Arthromyces matolae]|nr:hypothetical protein H0H93_011751 [Arthromyces matolae]